MWVRMVRPSAIKQVCLLIAVLSAGAAVLLFPTAVATGIRRGLTICGTVLIPGLLPFLVLSGFLVHSGLCDRIGRCIEAPMRVLFSLSGCCGTAILIGLCGGYPAGGAAVAGLYRDGYIDEHQAKRMLRFCVNAGPAFIISTVGAGLMGSVLSGVLLYAAHIAAALIIGIVDGWFARRKQSDTSSVTMPPPRKTLSSAAAFADAVTTACRSLVSMSGFVMLMAAFLSVCDAAGVMAALAPYPLIRALFPAVFEVSCGCVEAASHVAAPFLLGTMLGWGGVSVHGQLASELSGTPLLDRGFFAARVWHALLGGLLSALLFRLVPVSTTVMMPNTPSAPVAVLSGNAAVGSALLLMCGLFLLGTGRKRIEE